MNKIVGCIHAGWKGAFSGIIKNNLKMKKNIQKIIFCICSLVLERKVMKWILNFSINSLINQKKIKYTFQEKLRIESSLI